MLRLALLPAAILWSCTAGAEEPSQIAVADRAIMLRDLASIPPQYARLADRVVAEIPAGQTSMRLDEVAVRALIRREAPLLDLAPRREGALHFVLAAGSATGEGADTQASGPCLELAAPLDASDYIARADVREVSCDSDREIAPGLVFDRGAGATRTSIPLSASSYLGSLWVPEVAVVPGQTAVELRIASGPVVITRSAITLQPSRTGSHVFAENSDGVVVSVELVEEQ